MDELTSTLEQIIDDTQLPARPPVAQLESRVRRRRQRRALGGAAAVVAVAIGLIFGLMPGGTPKTGVSNASAELTAFKAGRTVLAQAGGPPVYTYGAIGSKGLWVLNGDGLFISTTGPSTFREITPRLGGSPIGRVLAVQFLDTTTGFVLANTSEGVSLTLDRTDDGGATWTPMPLPNLTPDGVNTATMDFLTPEKGFIALQGYVSGGTVRNLLLATTDGGSIWTVVDDSAPVSDITFTSTKTGWGVDRRNGSNQLYRTTDGGTSWSPVSLPLQNAVSWELPTLFGRNGVVVGRPLNSETAAPRIASTNDGGSSWALASAPPFPEPACASQTCAGTLPFGAVSATRWFYWAGLLLYSTTNGGRTWTETLPNVAFSNSGDATVNFAAGSAYSNPRSPITFTSPTDGWAIASSGNVSLILATTDGGRHFTAYSSPGGAP